jgi:hypothetical protein
MNNIQNPLFTTKNQEKVGTLYDVARKSYHKFVKAKGVYEKAEKEYIDYKKSVCNHHDRDGKYAGKRQDSYEPIYCEICNEQL